MTSSLLVVVCSRSLYLQAVAANLDTQPHIQTALVNPHHPEVLERVMALSPDVIMVDHNEPVVVDLTIAFLTQGYPLLDMDTQHNTVSIISRRRVEAATIADLAQLVGDVVEAQVSA